MVKTLHISRHRIKISLSTHEMQMWVIERELERVTIFAEISFLPGHVPQRSGYGHYILQHSSSRSLQSVDLPTDLQIIFRVHNLNRKVIAARLIWSYSSFAAKIFKSSRDTLSSAFSFVAFKNTLV